MVTERIMPLWPRAFPVIAALSALSIMTFAVPAQADDRCTGTLCDLYYGNAPAKEQKPASQSAAPTPIMVPKGGILGYVSNGGSTQSATSADGSGSPTSGSTSRVHVGGGGLLGMARGETPERCSGTICDLYYGGPPPEKPGEGAAPIPPESSDAVTEPAAAADEIADEPRTSRRRERVEFVEREQKPRCVAPPQDPWRCYR